MRARITVVRVRAAEEGAVSHNRNMEHSPTDTGHASPMPPTCRSPDIAGVRTIEAWGKTSLQGGEQHSRHSMNIFRPLGNCRFALAAGYSTRDTAPHNNAMTQTTSIDGKAETWSTLSDAVALHADNSPILPGIKTQPEPRDSH